MYTNIKIYPLDSSTREKRFLLSYNGRFYETNFLLVEILKELQQTSNIEEAVTTYVNKKEGKYTIDQVKHVINKFIDPIITNSPIKKKTFLYEKELFSSTTIDKFSNIFRFLFHRTYMLILFTIAIVLDIWFFIQTKDLLEFNNASNSFTIVGLLIFIMLSSLLHELGHASACKYFNIHHGGIGFGLYLNFPVLYTNVTEIWKLNRKQRLIVNLAGVYFQSVFMICFLLAFFYTNSDILRYFILIINFGFIMTLNPFFKFDGYWIASDLLGVPNLRQRSLELLDYLYKYILKKPIKRKPYLLQINSLEKYGLFIYSIIVNLFMGFYFFYIIPTFLYRFIQTFPDAINQLILYLSNRIAPPFALLRNISMQLIFFTLVGYLLYKTINSFIKKYDRKQ